MKGLIVLLVSALLTSGCAGMWPGMGHHRVSIIAHRGASFYAPENTLAAYALAARMKADWFELDCLLSRDGEVVVSHDGTVDRTTNGKGRIADMTLAQLKQLDAGSWKAPQFAGERIPTLREALELAKREKIGVYIEVKEIAGDEALKDQLLKMAGDRTLTTDPAFARDVMQAIEQAGTPNLELTRKTVALVRELGMQRQVVIQSFSPVICSVVRIEAPELRDELLGSDDPKNPQTWSNYLRFARMVDVNGCNLDSKSVTSERVKAFHEAGRTVAVWTVDDPAEMRRQVEMGVNALITNRPDVGRETLQQMGRD